MSAGLKTVSDAASGALRKTILAAAASGQLKSIVDRYGMRLGAARFVAGETLDECVEVLRSLNERGLRANTTLLGEGVSSSDEVRRVIEAYEQILSRLAAERLDANVALKLTHLGLAIDEELAFESVARLVRVAGNLGNFVRIDMEESRYVDATLRIYRRLRSEGHENVGTVLQAYLFRAEADLDELLPLKPNLRITKGAYLESAAVAYEERSDVDRNFVRLTETCLRSAGFTAVATHDERIIEHVISFAETHDIRPQGRFEFQMLYGVRPQYQLELARRGYPVLVATPFGPDWYPYLMRRLAERPANVGFVLKNLTRR